MTPTLRQIEAFRAVTETQSFSRAAARLGMAQPSLSQLIRDLETTLGTRLFDRTTRRVDLTEAGRAFAAPALAALTEIDRAVTTVQDLSALRRGTVTLAAPPLLAATVLPGVLADLGASHPGLTLRIMDLATDGIVAALRAGAADLGLGTFPPGLDGFDRVALLRDRLMVFDRAGAGAPPLRWADLTAGPVITLTRESGIRLLTEVGFETAETPFAPAHEVRQIATALALVRAGLGRAILPAYARAAAPDLQAIPLQDPEIAREITLLTLRDRAPSAAALALRAALRSALRDAAG